MGRVGHVDAVCRALAHAQARGGTRAPLATTAAPGSAATMMCPASSSTTTATEQVMDTLVADLEEAAPQRPSPSQQPLQPPRPRGAREEVVRRARQQPPALVRVVARVGELGGHAEEREGLAGAGSAARDDGAAAPAQHRLGRSGAHLCVHALLVAPAAQHALKVEAVRRHPPSPRLDDHLAVAVREGRGAPAAMPEAHVHARRRQLRPSAATVVTTAVTTSITATAAATAAAAAVAPLRSERPPPLLFEVDVVDSLLRLVNDVVHRLLERRADAVEQLLGRASCGARPPPAPSAVVRAGEQLHPTETLVKHQLLAAATAASAVQRDGPRRGTPASHRVLAPRRLVHPPLGGRRLFVERCKAARAAGRQLGRCGGGGGRLSLLPRLFLGRKLLRGLLRLALPLLRIGHGLGFRICLRLCLRLELRLTGSDAGTAAWTDVWDVR